MLRRLARLLRWRQPVREVPAPRRQAAHPRGTGRAGLRAPYMRAPRSVGEP